MTGKKKTPERYALDRLADLLVDDILDTPDQDILAEFRESDGDPEHSAAQMRALFETSLIAMNKRRLVAAKVGISEARKGRTVRGALVDITEARKRLRAILDMPNASPELTLAARKESELSDADILGMADDLYELGVFSHYDGKDEKS